uniref:C2H2-type domain-containing protein n=1 Tax=Timema genevievae TaxID=629358 RepID=A0A7R9K4A5_TIMGE|nr:unnamed protein product [Timema genevievae]
MPQQRSSRRGSGYHRGSSNRYPYQGPQWRQEFQSRQSSQDNFLSQLTSPEATLAIASNLISTLLQSQQTQVTWAADATNSGNMGKALALYQWGEGTKVVEFLFQVHGYTDRGQPGSGRGGSNYGQRGQYPNRKYGDYHNNEFYREGQVRRGGPQRGRTGGPYRERTTGTQRCRGTMGARGRGGSNKQPMRGKAAGKKDEAVDKKRNSKEKSKDPDKTKDDTEKKKIMSKYAGVPDMLFFCHICNKHLWDAQCFDKHLTGRPHTETFERQREGYKLKTLLLRKKLKLNTEKMELELDSPQPKKPRIQQFCAMCDTHYYGGVVLHRRTWDHQKIKSFMHPYCLICRKDFQARVDWDRHKLSAGHLKKVVKVLKERKASSNDVFTIDDFIFAESEDYEDEFSELEMKVRSREDEEKDILKRQDKQEQDTASVSTIVGEETDQPQMEGTELGTEGESKGDKDGAKEDPKVNADEVKQDSNGKEDSKVSGDEAKQDSNRKEDPKVSGDEAKLDSNGKEDPKVNGDEAKENPKENVDIIKEDPKKNGDEIKENPPSNKKGLERSKHLFKYDPDQIVGAAMLKPSRGLMCEVCRVFIKGEGHAKSHCSSLTHYNYYLAYMMAQDSREKMRAAKEAEQSALEKAKSLVADSNDNEEIKEEVTQEEMDTEEPTQDKEEQGYKELGDKEEPGDIVANQEEMEQQDIGIDEDKEV